MSLRLRVWLFVVKALTALCSAKHMVGLEAEGVKLAYDIEQEEDKGDTER